MRNAASRPLASQVQTRKLAVASLPYADRLAVARAALRTGLHRAAKLGAAPSRSEASQRPDRRA